MCDAFFTLTMNEPWNGAAAGAGLRADRAAEGAPTSAEFQQIAAIPASSCHPMPEFAGFQA